MRQTYLGGGSKGRSAPKPWWAYRGDKQSSKAHPVGEQDRWGGRYVEGGYEIDGQFFPWLIYIQHVLIDCIALGV